jgi:hypothetical protein
MNNYFEWLNFIFTGHSQNLTLLTYKFLIPHIEKFQDEFLLFLFVFPAEVVQITRQLITNFDLPSTYAHFRY